MYRLLILVLLFLSAISAKSNSNADDSTQIRAIYDEVLLRGEAYDNLHYLCKEIGNRVSGSKNARKAVDWSFTLMESYDFDKVWLQEVMVPHWERGSRERCFIQRDDGHTKELSIVTLGGSIATDGVLEAEVVEVNSIEDLKQRSDSSIKGKIVFINQAMDQRFIHTGYAYGSCAGIRVWGAAEAGAKGAVGLANGVLG